MITWTKKMNQDVKQNQIKVDRYNWYVMKNDFSFSTTKILRMKDENIPFKGKDGFTPDDNCCKYIINNLPRKTK